MDTSKNSSSSGVLWTHIKIQMAEPSLSEGTLRVGTMIKSQMFNNRKNDFFSFVFLSLEFVPKEWLRHLIFVIYDLSKGLLWRSF